MEHPPDDYCIRPRATPGSLVTTVSNLRPHSGVTQPFPESILARLDKMDARLKQLEEKQQSLVLMAPQQNPMAKNLMSATRRPSMLTCEGSTGTQEPHYAAEMGRVANSFAGATRRPSTPAEAELRKALVERLQFLESRIMQVSQELDKSSGLSSSSASSSTTTSTEESKWLLQPVPFRAKFTSATLPSRKFFTRPDGLMKWADDTHRTPMPKSTKMKEPKDVMEEAEKMKSSLHKEERKRAARTRLYKRWFPIGCR